MANDKMKVGLSFNGKNVEVELTQEQLKELGLIEEKKKTGYEKDYHHYYVASTGMVVQAAMNDHLLYDAANYYSDQTVAENNARADELMRKLRRFTAENGGIPSKEDWKDDDKNKYYIAYDYDYEEFFVNSVGTTRDSFQIYFNSKEACEKAIEEFKKDLKWFFTMYQAQLY